MHRWGEKILQSYDAEIKIVTIISNEVICIYYIAIYYRLLLQGHLVNQAKK
jgi:hypothetical protein